MSQTTGNPQKSREKIHLRPYRSPRLIAYGSLCQLTAGGSGKARESSMGKRPRP